MKNQVLRIATCREITIKARYGEFNSKRDAAALIEFFYTVLPSATMDLFYAKMKEIEEGEPDDYFEKREGVLRIEHYLEEEAL